MLSFDVARLINEVLPNLRHKPLPKSDALGVTVCVEAYPLSHHLLMLYCHISTKYRSYACPLSLWASKSLFERCNYCYDDDDAEAGCESHAIGNCVTRGLSARITLLIFSNGTGLGISSPAIKAVSNGHIEVGMVICSRSTSSPHRARISYIRKRAALTNLLPACPYIRGFSYWIWVFSRFVF